MKKSIFNLLKILNIALFIVLLVCIAIYPFPNRDLVLRVDTDAGEKIFFFGDSDINDTSELYMEFPEVDEVAIERIRVYGPIKSICLKTMAYGEVASCVESVINGEMIWQDSNILFKGNGNVKILFNANGLNKFQTLSKSFLMERICLMEVVLVIFLLFTVVVTALQEKYDNQNRNNHGPIKEVQRFARDIVKYKNYMIYAARTDLKAEVANSYLNRLWWLLEPFFNMLVYVIVFGGIMGSSIKNYATYVFSGLLMWNFFNKTINYSVKLVRNNKDIVTKVYVPKFVLLISNMILNLFKLLFSLIVLVVMFFVFRIQIGSEILMVIPSYIVLILFSFGLGMIFLHYGVYVDDLSYAVGILLSMLMFLSGVFYDVMSTLPEPINTIVLCANPIALVVDTMRNSLLYREITNVPLIIIWFLISFIMCYIGVHIVYKHENGYVKVV